MRRALRLVTAILPIVMLIGLAPPASADPKIPVPVLPDLPAPSVPGMSDCKDAPTPESPGYGIAGFFAGKPDKLPAAGDPFKADASTTIYEQYGYAGLRWRTYDLGCGPDAMRNPDAVIGTAVSNWVMQAPVALTALTGSLTEVAFHPTFLDSFDPVVERISSALHENLFVSWIPVVLVLLGFSIIFMARRKALASTAGAVGWALIVVILAAALFRWPSEAGHAADATVSGTIGVVVGQLDGDDTGTDPGTAVASQVNEAILYRSWLAGTLGSPDSATAKKYGAKLFKAQALTWRENAEAQQSPEKAKAIIEAKQEQWTEVADKIKEEDPEAYEHLTGSRSETRVGYSILSALATFLSLPFLLFSALLMLGCYFIVRLAVMLFPAFAVLGAFPSSRGLVTGLGKTVAAAVVNSIVFGIGAGVTVAVLGILFHPGGGAPAWLSLVLMPLFSLIMWFALKPFRRLTTMVSPESDHFGGISESMSRAKRRGLGYGKKLALASAAAATGGAAGAATAAALSDDDQDDVPDRAEARPTPQQPLALSAAHRSADEPASQPRPDPSGVGPADHAPGPASSRRADAGSSATVAESVNPTVAPLPEGFAPRPTEVGLPPRPTEPEWDDGEEVYPIYRPSEDQADDVA